MKVPGRSDDLRGRYEQCIQNAVEAVKTYRGAYESRQDIPVPGPTDFGREACFLKTPTGPTELADCHDDSVNATRVLKERECTWFDLDCNYCTGVPGLVLKRWAASAPPPNPQLSLTAGDRQVRLEWDTYPATPALVALVMARGGAVSWRYTADGTACTVAEAQRQR